MIFLWGDFMSQKNKKNIREAAEPLLPENADFAADEFDGFEEYEEEPALTFAEKAINYATLALALLLLGGSMVFWWVIGGHVIMNPHNLVDAEQMLAVLIACGVIPAAVSLVQSLLHRPINIERWLICMCLSGAIAALIVIFYQLVIRDVGFTLAEFPTLICCTISGCALPAVICLGLRKIIPQIAAKIERPKPYNAKTWEEVRRDILSLTDM